MKITICGSMTFAKEMLKVKEDLEKKGHVALVPYLTEKFVKDPVWHRKKLKSGEHSGLKKKYDLIRRHYKKVKEADAILVLNYDKNGVKNYIGGNSFLEMGFAHVK